MMMSTYCCCMGFLVEIWCNTFRRNGSSDLAPQEPLLAPPDWADLAPDLLEHILHKLTLKDYLNCRQTCSSWRTAVKNALATKPRNQLPFLLSLSSSYNAASLVSIMSPHRGLPMPILNWPREIEDVRSVQGWLMFNIFHYIDGFEDETRCESSFFNPVSCVWLNNLPELLFSGGSQLLGTGKSSSDHFYRTAFDSVPDSSNFLVVFLISFMSRDRREQRLAFCKGMHKSWTKIETAAAQTTFFCDVVVHEGKLYLAGTAAIYHGINVTVFSLEDKHYPNAIIEQLVTLNPLPTLHGHTLERYKPAMVTTRGELFLVFYRSEEVIRSSYDRPFRVFKLDSSDSKWCEVKDIGDRFLFWDWTGVKVIYNEDLDRGPLLGGGNYILFCEESANPFPKHDLGTFSVDQGRVGMYLRHISCHLNAYGRNIWFSPNLW